MTSILPKLISIDIIPLEACVSEVELVGQSILHAVFCASLSQELQSSQ